MAALLIIEAQHSSQILDIKQVSSNFARHLLTNYNHSPSMSLTYGTSSL